MPPAGQTPTSAEPREATIEHGRLDSKRERVTVRAAVTAGQEQGEDDRGRDDAKHEETAEHDDEHCGLRHREAPESSVNAHGSTREREFRCSTRRPRFNIHLIPVDALDHDLHPE
jgi:hypothetical protein